MLICSDTVNKEKDVICNQCATIVVRINGESFALHAGMILADFLQQRGYQLHLPMACAVNGRKVAADDWSACALQDGDHIDVVGGLAR